MTPKNPARMPLKEKILLGGLAAAAAIGAMLLADPEAKADDAPAPQPVGHCQVDKPCDPLTMLLGPPPVNVSTPSSWQDMLLPDGAP